MAVEETHAADHDVTLDHAYFLPSQPTAQQVHDDLTFELRRKSSKRSATIATVCPSIFNRITGRHLKEAGAGFAASLVPLSVVLERLLTVVNFCTISTIDEIRAEVASLPYTYDAIVLDGRITVLLCGKLLTEPASRGHVLRELKHLGVEPYLDEVEV